MGYTYANEVDSFAEGIEEVEVQKEVGPTPKGGRKSGNGSRNIVWGHYGKYIVGTFEPPIATGVRSHAEGLGEAYGNFSHVEGGAISARGEGSHAEGIHTFVYGDGAHAEGIETSAIGDFSHAEGSQDVNTEYFGNLFTVNFTTQEEKDTLEDIYGVVFEYYGTDYLPGNMTDNELYIICEEGARPYDPYRSADISKIVFVSPEEGEEHNIQAGFYFNIYDGGLEEDTNYFCVPVFGSIGRFSHTEGDHTLAVGDGAHAEGLQTVAKNFGEHAEGAFNKSNALYVDPENPQFGSEDNTIHSIGIGVNESDRKNAFEVTTLGDVYMIGVGGYDGTNPWTATTIQDVINGLTATTTDIYAALSAETTARVEALSAETIERISKDEAILTALTSEVENRISADELLSTTKQDKLEAGDGIVIADNVISADVIDDETVESGRTYSSQKIMDLLNGASFAVKVVDELPVSGEPRTIYFVPKDDSGETSNVYYEYLYVDNKWEKIGDTEIDLSQYYTKEEINEIVASIDEDLLTLDSGLTQVEAFVDNLAQVIDEKQDKLIPGTNITIEENVISSEQISDIEELPDASENQNRILRRNGDKDVFISKRISSTELTTNRLPDEQQIDKAYLYEGGTIYYYKGAYEITCSDGVLNWYLWERSDGLLMVATEENFPSDFVNVPIIGIDAESELWSDVTETGATTTMSVSEVENDDTMGGWGINALIPAIYNAPEANQIGNAVLVDDHSTILHVYTGEQTTITIDGHDIVVYKWQDIENPNEYVATNKKASEIYYTGSYPDLIITDVEVYDLNVTPAEYDEIYELYIPKLNAADAIQVGAASIQHMDFDQLYEYLGEGDYIDSEGEHKTLYGWRDGEGYYFCTVNPAEEIYGAKRDDLNGIVANLEIYNLSDEVYDNEDGTYTLDARWSYFTHETMMFYLHNFVQYQRTDVTEVWNWVSPFVTAGDNIIIEDNKINAIGYTYKYDETDGTQSFATYGNSANANDSFAEGTNTKAGGNEIVYYNMHGNVFYAETRGDLTSKRYYTGYFYCSGDFTSTIETGMTFAVKWIEPNRLIGGQDTVHHSSGEIVTVEYISSSDRTKISLNPSPVYNGQQVPLGLANRVVTLYLYESRTFEMLGDSSHAEGLNTQTRNIAEHAEGKYNNSNHDGTDSGNTIHSIGIGHAGLGIYDDYRVNAGEVMHNGDVYIKGIGGYTGINTLSSSSKTIQEYVTELEQTIANYETRIAALEDIVSNINSISDADINNLR